MSEKRPSTQGLISRILIVLAPFAITIIVLLYLLISPSLDQFRELKVLVPSVIGSILAVLALYLSRSPLLKFLEKVVVGDIFHQHHAPQYMEQSLISERDVTLYDGWYEVPWREILEDALELEVFVSFLDAWVNQNTSVLQAIFDRGGTVRIYLPKVGNNGAIRLGERFPEYSDTEILTRVQNTALRLNPHFPYG